MGNEVTKEQQRPRPRPQPTPRQRPPAPFPSRSSYPPEYPSRSTPASTTDPVSSSRNLQPATHRSDGFVYVETIPRPRIPETVAPSTSSTNCPSPGPALQVPQSFDSNEGKDNSDNESVISEVSSVGNYRENHHRGRGGRGTGFAHPGGIRKNYQQNYKNRVQQQQKVKELAKTSMTKDVPSQLSEADNQEDTSVKTIEKRLQNTKLKQEVINILLLGETGVGKSTFINSIVNYLSYQSFEQAEKEKLHILISSSFTEYDKDGKDVKVTVTNGESADVNEDLNVGKSATQQVKTYTFTIRNGEIRLRLIDTPGIGDTRGITQDEQNCQNILDYISQLHHLHAICYLFKPSEARATAHFKYCITQMFFRLEKSACNNLLFLFTNTRGGNFTPGETYSLLKDLADDIAKQSPDVKISVDDNKFCIDNEAFRYLAAVKQGVQYTKAKRAESMKSWQKSSETCTQLIDHILKLKPHLVNSTMSINECRRHIIQLTKPMAEITLLIEDNINQLDRHKAHMLLYKDDLVELKEKLYIPVLDVEVKKLLQPVTVCSNCAEPVKFGNITKWHYKKKCCPNCLLRNVPEEMIGSPELMQCEQMTGAQQSCVVCGHHYKLHLHIYYETQIVHKKQVDENIKKSIENKEALIETAKKTMENMERRKKELEEELSEIIKYNAKFAYFLQKNALASFNDSYEEYIQHTIAGEKHSGANPESINSLEKILKEHKEFKKSFAEAAEIQKKTGESDTVTPANIQKSIQNLYKLKHFGDKIKDMYQKQTSNIKKEHLATEYIHREVFKRLPQEKKAENKAKQNAEKLPKKKKKNKQKETGDAAQNNAQNNNPTGPNQEFQGQSQGYNNTQFNKNRGLPNNRRGQGFQRGRGANRNHGHRSRSRGPVQGREAPPPYDVAMQDPPYSPNPNPDFRSSSSDLKTNYSRDVQDPLSGTTIQVNVTLAPPDSSTTEPVQSRNHQYKQECPPPLPRDDRYAGAPSYPRDDRDGQVNYRPSDATHPLKTFPPPDYPPPLVPPREHLGKGYPPSPPPPQEYQPSNARPGVYPPNTYPDYPPGDSRPPNAHPRAPPQGTPQYDFRPPQGNAYYPPDPNYDPRYDNRPPNRTPEYDSRPPSRTPEYDNRPPSRTPQYEYPPPNYGPGYDRNRAPEYNNHPPPRYDNRSSDYGPGYENRPYDNRPQNNPRGYNSAPNDPPPRHPPNYNGPPQYEPPPSGDNNGYHAPPPGGPRGNHRGRGNPGRGQHYNRRPRRKQQKQ